MHLKQPRITYIVCGPFTKNKEKIKKSKEPGCWRCLCDKAFNITKNTKYDEYQRGLASVVYKFLDKKTSGGTVKKRKHF